MKFTGNGVEIYIQKLAETTALPAVPVTSLTAANPAVATVGAGAIANFHNGDVVTLSGFPGAATGANGSHAIANVSATTFEVVGLDLTAATGGPFTGSATPAPLGGLAQIPIVSLSNAKPAVATVGTGGLAAIVEGQALYVSGSGTSLDGRAFRAKSVNLPADTVTLELSDLSALTAPVLQGSIAGVPAADMLKICLTSFEHAKEAADPIDTSTMCGAEQLAGVSLPGNLSIEGFIDFDELSQAEWMLGTDDNQRRLVQVKMPPHIRGEIFYVATPSGFTTTFEVNEAVAFSAEGIVNARPTYYVGANA